MTDKGTVRGRVLPFPKPFPVRAAPAGVDLVGGHGDDARRACVAQQVHRAARAQLHHHVALPRVWLPEPCARIQDLGACCRADTLLDNAHTHQRADKSS